jgi:hypothetical protein
MLGTHDETCSLQEVAVEEDGVFNSPRTNPNHLGHKLRWLLFSQGLWNKQLLNMLYVSKLVSSDQPSY